MAIYSNTPKLSKVKLFDESYALIDKDARGAVAIIYRTGIDLKVRDIIWFADNLYEVVENISAADNTSFTSVKTREIKLGEAISKSSIVTDSETNGNIIVDGEEVEVYTLPDNVLIYEEGEGAEESTGGYLPIDGGTITGNLTVRGVLSDGETVYVKSTDTRLSDARNPLEHTHAQTDISGLVSALNGKADTANSLAGYGILDAKIANGTITLGENTIKPLTEHQDISGKANVATTISGYGITDAKIEDGVITLGNKTITPLTSHQDISNLAEKATTLAGYNISDAHIKNGVITLGENTITPVTDVSDKATKGETVTGVSYNNKVLKMTINGETSEVATASQIVADATAEDVKTALGYTPYNSTNPDGYTTNTGTVTSIIAGTGLNGGTISTTGTISVIYGNTAGTAVEGNDSRLSDARIPVSHTHLMSDITGLATELSDIREIASGKTKSYVISADTNKDFDSSADSITITSAITDVTDTSIALSKLKIGDNIFITETGLPDRFVGAISKTGTTVNSVTLYKLESTKVDLSPYTKYSDFTWDAATGTLTLNLPENK